jgi:predicted GIY-YIG superfamily endonuclease
MTFWAYMLHCNGGYFYVGHTDDLDLRLAQHQVGHFPGFTRDYMPIKLVWSADFPTRDGAIATERQLKGWSRAKKMALIRGDWTMISNLAKAQGRASITSAYAGEGAALSQKLAKGQIATPCLAQAELVDALPFLCHPDTPSTAAFSILAQAARSECGQLCLEFIVQGQTDTIKLPKPVNHGRRRDSLWKTTCFEAFVKMPNDDTYYELNLSPSTAWAAYQFSNYRSRIADPQIRSPHFDIDINTDLIKVTIASDLSLISSLFDNQPWHIGLSAVIEEKDGTKSYWALAHPPGQPDFHHHDCFALRLEAPAGS